MRFFLFCVCFLLFVVFLCLGGLFVVVVFREGDI